MAEAKIEKLPVPSRPYQAGGGRVAVRTAEQVRGYVTGDEDELAVCALAVRLLAGGSAWKDLANVKLIEQVKRAATTMEMVDICELALARIQWSTLAAKGMGRRQIQLLIDRPTAGPAWDFHVTGKAPDVTKDVAERKPDVTKAAKRDRDVTEDLRSVRSCGVCGQPMVVKGGGRMREYCSARCRKAASRRKR